MSVPTEMEEAVRDSAASVTHDVKTEYNAAEELISDWLVALDALERKRLNEQRAYRNAGLWAAGIFLLSALLLIFLGAGPTNWPAVTTLGIASFASLLVYAFGDPGSLKSMRQKGQAQVLSAHERQLAGSGIDQRLLNGFYDKDSIFNHTPLLLRWLLPRARPGDKLAVLDRISANLSWYLGPPRRFIRPSWFMPLPMLFNAGLALSSGLMGHFPGMLMSQLPFAGIFVLLGGMMSFGTAATNTQLSTPVLVAYLRRNWERDLAAARATGLGAATVKSVPLAEAGALGDRLVSRDLNVSLNLIINQLEQDLQQAMAKRLSTAMIVLVLIVTMLIAFPAMLNGSLIYTLFIFVPLLVFIGQAKSLQEQRKEQKLMFESRLERSELIASLLAGEAREDMLMEYAPWPFNEIIRFDRPPPAYASGLRRTLWRVALNLDWFLGTPRRFLPLPLIWRWANIALGAVALLLSFYRLHNSVPGTPVGVGWLALPLLAAACCIAWLDTKLLGRDWGGAEALISVLRKRLSE